MILINDLVNEQYCQSEGMVLPANRFFIPNSKFWNKLKSLGIPSFIDCGTGSGHIPTEAKEKGIRMSGCDIHRRSDAPPQTHISPAHHMPFNENISALLCRPDHSGWVEGLIPVVLEKGGRFIYVGLPDNVEQDIPEGYTIKTIAKKVGEEGEVMLEISGEASEEY